MNHLKLKTMKSMKALFKTLLLAVLVMGFSTAVDAQESKTKKDKYSDTNPSIESTTTQQQDFSDYAKNNPANKPESQTSKADRTPNANTAGKVKSATSATNKENYYAKREGLIKNDKRVNSKLSTEVNSKHPNAISPAEAQKWIQDNESKGTKGSTQSTNE